VNQDQFLQLCLQEGWQPTEDPLTAIVNGWFLLWNTITETWNLTRGTRWYSFHGKTSPEMLAKAVQAFAVQ
jgi:hypothetical protein